MKRFIYEFITVSWIIVENFSFKVVIDFVIKGEFDVFVVVGGGLVMDICKVVNFYFFNLKVEFLDYVNVLIGKGLFVIYKFKLLIVGEIYLYWIN